MPRPPVDLTDHLTALARHAGYDIDLDELDPVTGHQPHLVTTWALHTGQHATLAYTRWLLDGPAQFLRGSLADGEDTIAPLLLSHVEAAQRRFDTHLAHTTNLLTQDCRRLAATRLGLLWPRTHADTPARPDPQPHQRLTEALAAAGFTPDVHPDTPAWTRTSEGTRATVSVDGGVRLHVQPPAGPPWQATFTMSTPPAAIIAAATSGG